MKRRRLIDQVFILSAIGQVRSELKEAQAAGQGRFAMISIAERLMNLYALLNVEQLEKAVIDSDTRNKYKRDVA